VITTIKAMLLSACYFILCETLVICIGSFFSQVADIRVFVVVMTFSSSRHDVLQKGLGASSRTRENLRSGQSVNLEDLGCAYLYTKVH